MDDILIFAKTEEDLKKYTKEVLKVLKENDLYVKPEKCKFAKEHLQYLGFIIEENKISMDPAKVRGISEWPIPATQKQVKSFSGFGNFYQKFIRGFSELARPLNNLLCKDEPFNWSQDCQTSFETLKDRFCKEPVLTMPDLMLLFQIKSDASKYATGVLTQNDINGNLHPVAFISKTYLQQSATMISMTENYWLLSEHSQNGDTSSRDLNSPPMSYQITKISPTSGVHRNLIHDKPDGLYYSPNMTSISSIHPAQK